MLSYVMEFQSIYNFMRSNTNINSSVMSPEIIHSKHKLHALYIYRKGEINYVCS